MKIEAKSAVDAHDWIQSKSSEGLETVTCSAENANEPA